ncbi:hypothetical protein [Streptomyces sp. NPDC057702]|uniref:hypothetical protein n=1 Tax=unclassified Streptomyces TaxID=2593676 RepID=UPI00367BDE11
MTRLPSPTTTSPRPRVRRLARGTLIRAALCTATATLLASCGSDSSEDTRSHDTSRPPSAPTSARSPSTAPTSASPTPRPTLPRAKDGTNTAACRDGRCEVRVAEGGSVPVPRRSGVGQIEVAEVGRQTVVLYAPLVQPQYSTDGGCTMSIVGPDATSPGSMRLTCPTGTRAGVNKLRLHVVGALGKTAVLRFELASSDAAA